MEKVARSDNGSIPKNLGREETVRSEVKTRLRRYEIDGTILCKGQPTSQIGETITVLERKGCICVVVIDVLLQV